MTYYDKQHIESALLAWGMSLWLFLAAAFAGCAAKVPPGYEAGYRAGYEDYDSARYEHGDSRRLAEDLDYLRGYRDGLWGWLTGKW